MSKKIYKVVGDSPFQGHEPGTEFEAELDPFIEKWAKDNGYLEIVKGGGKNA